MKWKKVPFEQVFTDKTSGNKKFLTTSYQQTGILPIIDQGQSDIAGYTQDIDSYCRVKLPCVLFGDHTKIFKYQVDKFALGADGVKVLQIDDGFDPKFAFYTISMFKFPERTGYSRHFKFLKDAQIPCPPIEEQRRIATILDKIDTIRRKRLEFLKQSNRLIKSRFVEMFGDLSINEKSWELKHFSEFAMIDAEMTTDYKKYADFPHIGIDSIESETGTLCGYRTVKQDGIKSGKYLFTPDHIIYSKIRPNLNKVALPCFEGLCSADAYPILNKKKNCNKVYLAYILRSPLFLDYILPLSYRTNMPKVNREQITGFSMPLPPLELQNRFADFVRQADKSKFFAHQSLKEAQSLFNTITNEYFG